MARVEMVPGWESHMDEAINKFMEKLAKDVYDDMVVHCPEDTGRLKADLAYEVHDKTARIGAQSVPYAIYAEEGVGPHEITPHGAGALFWAGAEHPVKVVHHPGYHGSHFMRNALYKERS